MRNPHILWLLKRDLRAIPTSCALRPALIPKIFGDIPRFCRGYPRLVCASSLLWLHLSVQLVKSALRQPYCIEHHAGGIWIEGAGGEQIADTHDAELNSKPVLKDRHLERCMRYVGRAIGSRFRGDGLELFTVSAIEQETSSMIAVKMGLFMPVAKVFVFNGRRATTRAVRLEVGATLGLAGLLEFGEPTGFFAGVFFELLPFLVGLKLTDQSFKLRRRQFIDIAQFFGSGFRGRRWIVYRAVFAVELAVNAPEDQVALLFSKINQIREVLKRKFGKRAAGILALLFLLSAIAEVVVAMAQSVVVKGNEHGIGWSGGKEEHFLSVHCPGFPAPGIRDAQLLEECGVVFGFEAVGTDTALAGRPVIVLFGPLQARFKGDFSVPDFEKVSFAVDCGQGPENHRFCALLSEGSATLRCFALALCSCDTALAPCSPAFNQYVMP